VKQVLSEVVDKTNRGNFRKASLSGLASKLVYGQIIQDEYKLGTSGSYL
jgi:hypothetical protein